MRTFVCSLLLTVFATAAAAAGNFSGRWAIQNTSGRGGRGGPTILTLNHVGNEVTGTITARIDAGTGSPVNTEILGGKVEGDAISFYVWTGSDQPAKTSYQGKMSAAGDEIQFTVSGGRGNAGGFGGAGGRGQTGAPQQVVAKRTK
jgi:hypothetical protein